MSGREDNFGNGIFWEYYKDLERQFENFLEYVPYLCGNEKTYSFRLANIILAIGAHVDSAFKEIAKYPEFFSKYPEIFKTKDGKQKKPTIRDYYVLSEEYKLPQRIVKFKCLPERVELTPFQQYQKVGKDEITPYWWRVYNGVKHEFSKNFRKASLQNTRDALAGAFLLNVIHEPAVFRLCDYGVLKFQTPFKIGDQYHGVVGTIPSCSILRDTLKKKQSFTGFVETPLFIYDYDQ